MKLIQGDCLIEMQNIPDDSVDLILTDPPYGTTACKWDSVIPFKPMWKQLNRIIKSNGAIVLFGSEPFSSALRMSNIKKYKYDWIWDKKNPTGFALVKKQPMRQIENICIFYSKQPTYNRQWLIKDKKHQRKNRGKNIIKDTSSGSELYNKMPLKFSDEFDDKKKNPINILYYPKGRTGKVHPTQKPVVLMEYLIKTYTNEGETVLDFTMGSGSTGVAAKNLNRKFIGIELDDNYFEIAKKRIEEIEVLKNEIN